MDGKTLIAMILGLLVLVAGFLAFGTMSILTVGGLAIAVIVVGIGASAAFVFFKWITNS